MQLLLKSPNELDTEFLGIIEYSKHFVIGWLEDPHSAVELNGVSLRYPLEFIHKPLEVAKYDKPTTRVEARLDVAWFVPEFGIEEERVVAADEVRTICASSPFGRKYIAALKKFYEETRVVYSENYYVPRPQTPKP